MKSGFYYTKMEQKNIIKILMKPARGPQTMFFSNYCSGIPGLANYEMPNEVCEGNFGGTFFRHRDSRSARNGCHGAAGLGKSRQV